MLGRTDSRLRHLLVLGVLLALAASLVVRLGYWQLVESETLAAQARAQTTLRIEEAPRRGEIFDRSGTVVLATTVDRYTVAVAADRLTEAGRSALVERLGDLLGLDAAGRSRLAERLATRRPYVVVARDVEEATAGRLRAAMSAGQLRAVSLEPTPSRVYPQPGGAPETSLASQLLGFVNREGVGQYGVEQRYEPVLAGSPRVVVAQQDASSRPIPDTARVVDPGTPALDLRLTIDAGLQLAVEQEVLAAWVADRAASVSAIVMDPATGAIYASASVPAYDANAFARVAASDPDRFVDPIVAQVYEPGSVMKMFTAVAALGRGVVELATPVRDTATLTLDGGRTSVANADRKGMGKIPFRDVIAYSRNVGTARVARLLGPTVRDAAVALYDTWTSFGIGSPTGIDVAGEVAGLARDPRVSTWREIDLANASFGQGVAVTLIQLATAYSAMVNGGTLVTPHVVAAVGDQEVAPAPRAGGLLDPTLRDELVGLMAHVVEEVPFYRNRTLVPGYVVGGKTGTAQIWDGSLNGGAGGWLPDVYNYSFVGYIGRSEPELIIAVRIARARPTVVKVGHLEMPVMSFELFRRIATDAMTILDLGGRTAAPGGSGASDGSGG
jgi:cell division protein FtsI/penicillin-binding protein 2